MKFTHLAFIPVLLASTLASAQGTVNVASFANSLEEIRGECSQMASKLSGESSTAELKQRLDSDLRRMKSRGDVQVYAVGHGRQQTMNYQLEVMTADSEADAAERQQISKQRDEGVSVVNACVEKALEKGKALYSGVKRNKKNAGIGDTVDDGLACEYSIHFLLCAERLTGVKQRLEKGKSWRRAIWPLNCSFGLSASSRNLAFT
ncbi:hypothetical protein [Comamonas sp. wu1-DMT]|uniref:hypothetical protein n=1 Tax=Comamonas sp. wu1-DMT TaxID=3126390 RepID=UPI0032E461A3